MKTLQKQISLFGEEKSTSSQEDSPANLTVQRERDLEKKMTVTSGRRCLEQFERFDQHTSWGRTFSALLIGMEGWFSRRCRLTWKLKGTKFNRMYFQLQASTLPTAGIESGLLLTPTTVMTDEHPDKMRERAEKNGYKNGTKYCSLLSQVKYSGMMPTPQARDWKGMQGRGYKGESYDLPGVVMQMIPTPRCATNNGRGYSKNAKKGRLEDVMAKETGSETSQLKPQFVMEMMGFPPTHTEEPFKTKIQWIDLN